MAAGEAVASDSASRGMAVETAEVLPVVAWAGLDEEVGVFRFFVRVGEESDDDAEAFVRATSAGATAVGVGLGAGDDIACAIVRCEERVRHRSKLERENKVVGGGRGVRG